MQNGDTSLHISAAMGRRKLTRVLLESGCDREMKNKQGETAAEIARRKSLAEIVQILKNTPPSISINPSEKYGKLQFFPLILFGYLEHEPVRARNMLRKRSGSRQCAIS